MMFIQKNDTNDAFSYFHNNLKVMYDQAFPIKNIEKNISH